MLDQCEEQLNGTMPKGALLYMSVDYEHWLALQKVKQHWLDIAPVGGPTDCSDLPSRCSMPANRNPANRLASSLRSSSRSTARYSFLSLSEAAFLRLCGDCVGYFELGGLLQVQ